MSFFPQLRELTPEVAYYGVGGDELKSRGMELLYHLKDFSSMGFSEVLGKIPFYFGALKKIESEVIARRTTTAILVDFQDFNMRLARRLKKRGVRVLYYVAPQAWAWKAHRAHSLALNTHTLFTILPFEKDWFTQRGVKQVRSIPHPLMLTYKNELHHLPEKPFGAWDKTLRILLLPGSRRFEVYNLLPVFMDAIRILRKSMKVEVHLVEVPHINRDFYRLHSQEIDYIYPSEKLVDAMKICHFSLAASGTVTLSTGLFEIPTVVCYKASLLNEFIFNNFIKYQGPISLTNIIHNQRIFPEFVQADVDAGRIALVIRTWTSNENLYNSLKGTLRMTKQLLSGETFSVPRYMEQVIRD